MSTSNFCYDNRCIVVSNDDYDNGNVPEIGDYIRESNRSYGSSEIITEEDFDYYQVIITAGYYADSCIDYKLKESAEENFYQDNQYYTLKKRTLAGLLVTEELERTDAELKEMFEKACAKEEKKVNKYLNKLKKGYGYPEVKCIAHFSNGEAVYREVK